MNKVYAALKNTCFVLCLLNTSITDAQVNSVYNFSFLKSSPSAQLTSLNGSSIARSGKDVSVAAYNPSLLSYENDKQLNFQSQFVPTGISDNYFGYAFFSKKLNTTFYPQIQYLNYGTFIGADAFGNKTSDFTAREWAFSIGAAKQLTERLSIGLTGKFINSQFDVISARAVAFDLAGTYHNPETNFDFTVLLKNVGGVLKDFSTTSKSQLPIDVQIGLSKRLGKSPLRFSVAADELTRWSLTYNNQFDASVNLLDNTAANTPTAFGNAVDNIFRHLKFGAEINFGAQDNFLIRAGYNYRTKQELVFNNIRSFGGLSLGVGFRLGGFHFDYATALQNGSGSVQHIGISSQFGYSKKVEPTPM